MNSTEINASHTTAIRTLAAIGFIVLVGAGIWLAVYSTRYVPSILGRVGSAAVYLGSVFTPSPTPSLVVVPTPSTASSTILSFGTEVSSTTQKSATATRPKSVTPTSGTKTSGTYPISGTSGTTLYGFPDFIVTMKAIGYLATSSADSFVASGTVPVGSRPAVSFTILNVGTNVSGSWRFSASIPTQTSYIYQSQLQQSLAPGDSIDYILGFDQANKGADQTISITANFDNAVAESNPNNNSASTKVTILGN